MQADGLNEASVVHAISDAVEIEIADELVVDNCRRQFGDQLAQLAKQASTPRQQGSAWTPASSMLSMCKDARSQSRTQS